MQEWYVRSTGRTGAHHGHLSGDGTVTARCGLTFTPQPDLFGAGPLILRPPIDPARCCPACVAGRHDDADALRTLIEGL